MNRTALQRWCWFVGLWVASISVLTVVAWVIRLVL
jgi:hypothetical protein